MQGETTPARRTSLIHSALTAFLLAASFGMPVAANAGPGGGSSPGLHPSEDDYELKLLGKYVFYDEKLSEPARQGCVTCHDPRAGGTPAIAGINKHQVAMNGANPHGHGALATPTNTYASFIPDFHVNSGGTACRAGGPFRIDGLTYCGGNFWNGRAQGPTLIGDGVNFPQETDHIGDEVYQGNMALKAEYGEHNNSISDQALNPFVNPVEQGTTREVVCAKVAASKYAPLFEQAWGEPINCSEDEAPVPAEHGADRWVDISFKRLAMALGAYQASFDVNSFSSWRDFALRTELACLTESNPDWPTLEEVLGSPAEWSKYFDPADYYVANVCDEVEEQIQEIVANTDVGKEPRKLRPGLFPLVLFTYEQNLGHDLFYNLGFSFPPAPPPFPDLPVTNCTECHLSDNSSPDGTGLLEQYTDFRYHNIGSPANPEIGMPKDPGLSGHLLPPELAVAGRNPGGHKTPGLRNVGKTLGEGWTRNYGHNGWFKSLESIVHFYNTAFLGNCSLAEGNCEGEGAPRRPSPYELTTAAKFGITRCEGPTTEAEALRLNCWPEPEWPQTAVVGFLLGNLGMTAEEEAAMVAYMRTFDDSHTATAPPPYNEKKAKK